MRRFQRRAARLRAVGLTVALLAPLLASVRGAPAAPEPSAAPVAKPDARDATFGGAGSVVLDLGGDDASTAVAVDADGRILVAGTTRADVRDEPFVTVLGADGARDASRGAEGTIRVDVPPAARVLALAPGPDGTLLLGGVTHEKVARAFVVRLLPDGRRDPSFTAELPASLATAGADAAVLALALDAGGRIVVAGRDGGDAFVARLAPNGALDRGFARDGMVTIAPGRPGRVVAAAVAPDGGAAFLAATSPSADAPFVLRTHGDGVRDDRFGRDGVAELSADGARTAARSLALDAASGRLVAGVTHTTRDGEHALLIALASDGRRDDAFGAHGIVDATAATRADVGASVAVQPDGRIVAVGTLGTGPARDVAVARFGAASARCGDGRIASGEQCDDGPANGGAGSCCSASCTLLPTGAACRPADGACDEAELCDGRSPRCPDDAFARAGAPCRAAAGACDVAETCSGTSRECPANDVRPRGTVCRVAGGACDLDEECDGVAGECPADAKRTGECRASRGGCDPAEWCDGSGNACPADVLLLDGAACDDGDTCTSDDVCVANVCRGGARDDFACEGWLCSRMRSKRLVTGEPPGIADLRALGLAVRQVDGARMVCRPAIAADASQPGTATPRGDDADARAGDIADDRDAYVGYRVTPLQGRRAQESAPLLVSATVEDRFGTLELAPRKVWGVSLPASVGAAEAGAPPGGTAYQCQQIDSRDVVATEPREVAVRVLGEASSESYRVEQPLRVCHPLGPVAGVVDQEDARVCYGLRRLGVETATSRGPLLVADAFATILVGVLGEPQLCVPALLVRAEWQDPTPRRKRQRDSDGRKPHRRRNPDHEPRPHRGQRPPHAADDPARP